MKRSHLLLPLAAPLALAACGGGGQSQSENQAEALEEAAEQSDPAAAQVLENTADAVREGDANAQQALQQAGNAQAATVPQPQQTPPPKVPTGEAASKHEGNAH